MSLFIKEVKIDTRNLDLANFTSFSSASFHLCNDGPLVTTQTVTEEMAKTQG